MKLFVKDRYDAMFQKKAEEDKKQYNERILHSVLLPFDWEAWVSQQKSLNSKELAEAVKKQLAALLN
jgi:hypothetical protein